MTFATRLLPQLRCPACHLAFQFNASVGARHGRGEFGTLTCRCAEYPVVDGIPIIQRSPVGMFEHTTGTAQVKSASPAELVALINSGRPDEALTLCVMPEPRRRLRKYLEWRGRRAVARLLANRDTVPARAVLGYFFDAGPLPSGTGDYFVHRIGQPRFLAALAATATLADDARPVLDLACGVGHLDHYLTRRSRAVPVVGVDMNFFHVWIARHWIAPSAHYVCSNLAEGLPFQDAAFSATVVSDAYHYLPSRGALNAELQRVAPGGMLILTRVGNLAVMPNEGSETSLAGYIAEIGAARSVHVFAEERLVRDYLARRNPLQQAAESGEVLQQAKWLTFVCNATEQALAYQPGEEPRPHGVGRIARNPIYALETNGESAMLRFSFPATWFAYENHQMLEYHPRRAQLRLEDLALLERGGWNDNLERALEQFLLLGLPERY